MTNRRCPHVLPGRRRVNVRTRACGKVFVGIIVVVVVLVVGGVIVTENGHSTTSDVAGTAAAVTPTPMAKWAKRAMAMPLATLQSSFVRRATHPPVTVTPASARRAATLSVWRFPLTPFRHILDGVVILTEHSFISRLVRAAGSPPAPACVIEAARWERLKTRSALVNDNSPTWRRLPRGDRAA
jgi:hypothetical protein